MTNIPEGGKNTGRFRKILSKVTKKEQHELQIKTKETKKKILFAFEKFENAQKNGSVKDRKLARNALGNVVVELINLIGDEDMVLHEVSMGNKKSREPQVTTQLQDITIKRKTA